MPIQYLLTVAHCETERHQLTLTCTGFQPTRTVLKPRACTLQLTYHVLRVFLIPLKCYIIFMSSYTYILSQYVLASVILTVYHCYLPVTSCYQLLLFHCYRMSEKDVTVSFLYVNKACVNMRLIMVITQCEATLATSYRVSTCCLNVSYVRVHRRASSVSLHAPCIRVSVSSGKILVRICEMWYTM